MDSFNALEAIARDVTKALRYEIHTGETIRETMNKYNSRATTIGVLSAACFGFYTSNQILNLAEIFVQVPTLIRFTLDVIAAYYLVAYVELPAGEVGYKLGLSRVNSVLRKKSGIESHV